MGSGAAERQREYAGGDDEGHDDQEHDGGYEAREEGRACY